MPNARVGALPQPSKPKEQQQQEMSGRGRGSRHKGITMEDLKQQTAMRLAQEQHHHKNGLPGGSPAGGYQNDGAAQQQDPTNVLNNSHLAHFNHYNSVHQHSMLHHAYEMRDRVYSADGSCTSSLTNENGGETSSTGLPVSAPPSSAAAMAGAAAVGLSPMGHAPSTRTNHPLLVATQPGPGDNDRHNNKNAGKGNFMGTSKSNYVRGSPSHSQRQPSSQQVHLGGQGNRPKSLKKKQQRQKMTPDADIYSPSGQQQYLGYASMDMNNPSPMTYSAPAFQSDRQQRSKKGSHRHGANAHGHFYPQSGMPHHGYHEIQFGGKQSKLPHGLTVQELKEMTKARLAAEAAEKNDPHGTQNEDQYIVMQQDQAQPDVSSNHSVVTQASSSSDGDSYRRLENKQGQSYYPCIQNRQNSMESASSAPTSGVRPQYQTPRTMSKSQSHHGLSDFSHPGAQPQRQMQTSPEHSTVQNLNQHAPTHRGPPPGLSNVQQGHLVSHHSNQNVQNQNQATHQRQQEWRQHMDALETASVNSMNSGLGSEYYGSESAIGSAQHTSSVSMTDDNANLSFGRSRSYPAGGNISNALEQSSHENTPMSTTTTPSSLFDYSSGGPNRRRTSTMSPPLSNLHEDRPLTATSLCADDYLSIPLFDSTPNSQPNARVHHVEFSPSPAPSRESSPAFSRYGVSNPNLGSGSMSDMFHHSNSVSSVPTVTPSMDNEDDHEDLPPLSFGLSDRATSTGGVSMSEELPNSVAESVLGTPLIMEGRKVAPGDNNDLQHSAIKSSDENDISAVFRNNPGYVGSDSGALGYHVPGREVSLSSTSSFFSETNILGQSSDFGASRSRTHSWAGSANNAMTPIGASSVPGPPSNLADDLNKLLDFSDTKESNALSTPWEGVLEDDQKRAPSLVSRIDPELKVGSGISSSSLPSSCPMGGDPLLQCQDPCVPPAPSVSDTVSKNNGVTTLSNGETTTKDKNSTSVSSNNNKRGGSTKRKNRRGRRKPKGDQRAS